MNELEREFYDERNDLLNTLSVTSPCIYEPAQTVHSVPVINEFFRNRIVKMDGCLQSKAILFDSNENKLLVGTSCLFNWKISTPQGHSIATLSRNIQGTEYIARSASGKIKEICFVKYFGLYSTTGPRVFHVYTDPKDSSYTTKLSERVRRKKNEYVKVVNKPPYFNYDTNSYVLNFNGRVTMPSTRNFQIIHPRDTSYITMTFGKISRNEYVLDYTYPWSGIEAFSIALSSFSNRFGID